MDFIFACAKSHTCAYYTSIFTKVENMCRIFPSRVSSRAYKIGPVCVSVCLGLLRAHYTPLQPYMGYLCTRKAQYAPPRRNMHYGAQGRRHVSSWCQVTSRYDVLTSFDNFWARILTRRTCRRRACQCSGVFIWTAFDSFPIAFTPFITA